MYGWMDDDGFLIYQHYQKPMASTKVIHSQSVPPMHTQEILRRLLNSSIRLSWEGGVAPYQNSWAGWQWLDIKIYLKRTHLEYMTRW